MYFWKYTVAAILFVARTEEMVETDIMNRGGRLEGRHVTPTQRSFRRAQHGHDGVPADSRTNATFQLRLPGYSGSSSTAMVLMLITGPCACRDFHAAFARLQKRLVSQITERAQHLLHG